VGPQQPGRGVEMQPSLVEAPALSDRQHAELVGVVRNEHDARVQLLSVDSEPDSVGLANDGGESTEPRQRVAPPPVMLAAGDEARVETERDVVQEEAVVRTPDVDRELGAVDERIERADRVVAVEADVAREVVPRPEWDADERDSPFERDAG